ncbi:hypothetical protein [Streptomyces cellulosae]|uniref:hypothetical protein n=1 Tax=Streptomyces cellulosae TaxID=1968 RepID=UPI0004C543C3|nr:hypothetical protein [Streptomyces cellulosae]
MERMIPSRRTALMLGIATAAAPWLGRAAAHARPATAGHGTPTGLDEPGITGLRWRTDDGTLDAERLTRSCLARV